MINRERVLFSSRGETRLRVREIKEGKCRSRYALEGRGKVLEDIAKYKI